MIPDCQKRLQTAVEDLQGILDGLEGEELTSSDEAKAAKEALHSASTADS